MLTLPKMDLYVKLVTTGSYFSHPDEGSVVQQIDIQPVTENCSPPRDAWFNIDKLLDMNLLECYFHHNLRSRGCYLEKDIMDPRLNYYYSSCMLKDHIHKLSSTHTLEWHFENPEDKLWLIYIANYSNGPVFIG
jgi:hypothetical protein